MTETYIRVKNKKQLQSAVNGKAADVLLLDFGCASVDIESLKSEHSDLSFFLQMPDILREKKSDSVKKIAERALLFDGILIKTFDEIALVNEVLAEKSDVEDQDFDKWQIIGDAFLYAYNTEALAFYKNFFPNMKFILPDELTDREIIQLIESAKEKGIAEKSDFIYKVYGYQPLMITNQCLNRNYTGCEKPLLQFADEKKNQFYISSECGQCYDIVYNGQPTVMLDKMEATDAGFEIEGTVFHNILLDFTVEKENEMDMVLGMTGEGKLTVSVPERFRLTRGHHYKGVE